MLEEQVIPVGCRDPLLDAFHFHFYKKGKVSMSTANSNRLCRTRLQEQEQTNSVRWTCGPRVPHIGPWLLQSRRSGAPLRIVVFASETPPDSRGNGRQTASTGFHRKIWLAVSILFRAEHGQLRRPVHLCKKQPTLFSIRKQEADTVAEFDHISEEI